MADLVRDRQLSVSSTKTFICLLLLVIDEMQEVNLKYTTRLLSDLVDQVNSLLERHIYLLRLFVPTDSLERRKERKLYSIKHTFSA